MGVKQGFMKDKLSVKLQTRGRWKHKMLPFPKVKISETLVNKVDEIFYG